MYAKGMFCARKETAFTTQKAIYKTSIWHVSYPQNTIFRLCKSERQCTNHNFPIYNTNIQAFTIAHVFMAYFKQKFFNFKITHSQNSIINQNDRNTAERKT